MKHGVMSFEACAHIDALEIEYSDQFLPQYCGTTSAWRFCIRMRSGTIFGVAFSSFAMPIGATFIYRTAKLSKPSGRSPEVDGLPHDTSSRGAQWSAMTPCTARGPETYPNFSSR
jgi:hypothetical protein